MLRLRFSPTLLASGVAGVDICVEHIQRAARRRCSTAAPRTSRVAAFSLPLNAPPATCGAADCAPSRTTCLAGGEGAMLTQHVASVLRRVQRTQRAAQCMIPCAWSQRRMQSTSASGEERVKSEGGGGAAAEEGAKSDANATGEGEKDGKGADGKAKKGEPKGFVYQLRALQHDMKEFPDIYNATTFVNFLLFTIFCLCSTGSNTEEKWWMEYWGIDAKIMPTGWILHSLLMNNFMSMAYAMMLVHSMCHAVMPTLGGAKMLTYLAIISVASGLMMQGFNFAMDIHSEKQFGPWDFIAGLFVMQFMHQGIMPWTIVNGFSGWVKYASWVGSVCILYYDYQPVVCGSLVGLLLCKTKFKPLAAKAAA